MFVQLNTYITVPIKVFIISVCFFFFQAGLSLPVYGLSYDMKGKNEVIVPVVMSEVTPLLTDVYIYCSGSRIRHNIQTAGINYSFNDADIYNRIINISAGADLYTSRKSRLSCSLGYRSEFYSTGRNSGYGVKANWLLADIGFSYSLFGLGAVYGKYLTGRINDNINHTYQGLNSNCFNSSSFCSYGFMAIRTTGLKIEVRVGYNFINSLNPDRIAFYNMKKNRLNNLYWEVRVGIRIFTTNKILNSTFIF